MESSDQDSQIEKMKNTLDDLTLRKLDLLDEQLVLMTKMSSLLTNGFIDLAKTRYIKGESTVSTTQIPGEDSVFEAVVKVDRDVNNRLSLKKNEETSDPIKWFGVLVPTSLKQSQTAFSKALETAVDLVNIRREWLESLEEFKSLSLKTSS